MSDTVLVKELQLLNEIEAISESYQEKHGLPPKNVSTWDPSKDIPNLNLLSTLPRVAGDGKSYIFSYTLSDNSRLRGILGYRDHRWRSLVSHSGSANIVMNCNWLRAMGAKRILIIGPRYFTVPHCLSSLGIDFETTYCLRDEEGYSLPNVTNPSDFDGVWVTNPIYGTGVYLNPEQLVSLQECWTSMGRYFVLDECLSGLKHYGGPHLHPNARTTIIAAPHKSVCVNAYKFAISIFDDSQLEHFEHWSDVWIGCLPQSSHQAIEHVLGGGFQRYERLFEDVISKTTAEFLELTELVSGVEVDKNALGYFRSVYFRSLSSELGVDMDFLRSVTFETGATFIPGIRNELDPGAGLSFRVNLAAFDVETKGAYVRLLRYLSANV